MEAINILARQQFKNIKGLQSTEKVPKFIKDEERWNVNCKMDNINMGPSVQVHHTGKDHWVPSLQTRNGDIYLFDSLGNVRSDGSLIPTSLKIQLAILYGKCKRSIKVITPDVQRQNNSVYCGVYTLAHLVQFCISENINNTIIFNSNLLRKHLLKIYETNIITEFPSTSKYLTSRRKKIEKSIVIDIHCVCGLPECIDNMVQCEKCSTANFTETNSSQVSGIHANSSHNHFGVI